jgi:hypothetical protein
MGTDGRTDRRTDAVSYRGATSRLKTWFENPPESAKTSIFWWNKLYHLHMSWFKKYAPTRTCVETFRTIFHYLKKELNSAFFIVSCWRFKNAITSTSLALHFWNFYMFSIITLTYEKMWVDPCRHLTARIDLTTIPCCADTDVCLLPTTVLAILKD